MKDLDLSFLAQRLDNQDPDHMAIHKNGRLVELAEGDMDKSQKLDRHISKVSLDGSQVHSEGYHAALLLKNEFLLKTPSDQRDDAGRIAPILCHGHVSGKEPESWPCEVVEALTGFAGSIDRTISEKEEARRGVKAILKRKRRNSRLWKIAFVLSGIGIIYWTIRFLINVLFMVLTFAIGSIIQSMLINAFRMVLKPAFVLSGIGIVCWIVFKKY